MAHYILGISAHYHDSSACLLRDGVVIAAVQEERFTRKKHDESFPAKSIEYCLVVAKIEIKDLDAVVYYEKPILKFERLLKTYIKTWPWGFLSFHKAMKAWLGGKLWIESEIRKELGALDLEFKKQKNEDPKSLKKKPQYSGKIYFVSHHLGHAASTYFSSGFENSTILTLDGVGEWATTTIGVGKKNKLELTKEIHFPHSIGLFYSAFTYYLGFKVNSAEYKLMGLAPYGKPIYKDKIYELLNVFEDGSFELKQEFFTYQYSLRMVGKKFEKHFDRKVRVGEEAKLEQFHKDMAASLQVVTEELVLGIVDWAYKKYPNKNLCLAGGVALNCVSNGRVTRESRFQNVYIFPASGDAGGSVGAAQYFYFHSLKNKLKKSFTTPYLGPKFENGEIEKLLKEHKIPFVLLGPKERAKIIAQHIANNKIIGHFAGRMEFGPRALGNRSIIADPRQKENWQRVNLKIKFRESFRPFAPSVLLEKSSEIFDLKNIESPYMLLTAQTKAKNLPAITHVDNSARIQTVSREGNEVYYNLIAEFEKLTKCPVVINTSFNVRGEPIVCTPLDALKGYLRTEMDILVLEDCLIELSEETKIKFRKKFTLEVFEKD